MQALGIDSLLVYLLECKILQWSKNSKTQNYRSKLWNQGCKILHFWIPLDVLPRHGQTLWASRTKFCIQVDKYQGHLHAKFQLTNQILSGFFGQKMPKNAPKMPEIWFFGYSSQIMSLNSMKFCVVRLDLDMKLQEKFHWLVISHFAKIQFWIFSKFWIFLLETVFKFFQPR